MVHVARRSVCAAGDGGAAVTPEDVERLRELAFDLTRILLREGNAEAAYERQLAQALRERDEARAARDHFKEQLRERAKALLDARAELERLELAAVQELDEARAEVERLERLFQQTHGVHHSWVDARHKVAERQREACAESVKRLWGVGDYNAEVQACRATPLVTEGDK